jgi:hypothetical protein
MLHLRAVREEPERRDLDAAEAHAQAQRHPRRAAAAA